MLQTEVVEKVKTHISNLLKNLAICEEMHVHIVEPDMAWMIVLAHAHCVLDN